MAEEVKFAIPTGVSEVDGKRVINQLYSTAVDKGLITADNLAEYKRLRALNSLQPLNAGATEYRQKFKAQVAAFQDIKDPDTKLQISRLMGLETSVFTCLHNADRKGRVETLKKSIQTFMEAGLKDPKTRGDFIQHVSDLLDKGLIISLVNTMHPTIYHSPEHIGFEQEFTTLLESAVSKDGKYIPEADLDAGIKLSLSRMMDKMVSGDHTLSHSKQITVPEENDIAKANRNTIQAKYPEAFREAWNAVVQGFNETQGNKPYLKANEKPNLNMTEKHLVTEFREWGEGLDADGRHLATSAVLHNTINGYLRDATDKDREDGAKIHVGKVYDGPTLDPRQNAKQHLDAVSALIQAKVYRSFKDIHGEYGTNKGFFKFCDDFISTLSEKSKSWDTKKSILQELSDADQAEFMKQLIKSPYVLLPQRKGNEPSFEEHVLAFHKDFPAIFEQFLKDHRKPLDEYGLTDIKKITYLDLVEKCIPVSSDGKPLHALLQDEIEEKLGFDLDDKGYFHPKKNASPSHALFEYTHKKYPDGTIAEIGREERPILADAYKRLIVLKDAILKYGSKVCDRHQIANFEGVKDFYSAMLLFKEAGIIKMKDGVVTEKPLIGIQPLIEDSTTMRRAPDIFSNLLKDESVASYYEQRGVAEFMIGYSDGAKSAGNFASEWTAHECMRKLKEVFDEKNKQIEEENKTLPEGQKNKPIEVRFFRGPGRGVDRGGPLEYGAHDFNLPESVLKGGVYDATIQADLPLDMRMSPSYGQDAFGQMVLGRIQATVAARSKVPNEQQEEQDSAIIQSIANMSEEGFKDLVGIRNKDEEAENANKEGRASKFDAAAEEKKNDCICAFLNRIPDNKDKSSRRDNRDPNAKPDFATMRAVGVEYKFNMAGLPAHNVGIAKALNKIKEEKGLDALVELYQHNRFFQGMINKLDKGMDLYNPTLALHYAAQCKDSKGNSGEKSEVYQHINEIVKDLDGVKDVVNTIVQAVRKKESKELGPLTNGKKAGKEHSIHDHLVNIQTSPNWQEKAAKANRNVGLQSATFADQDELANMGQAFLSSFGGKVDSKLETVRNAVFTVAQSIQHRFSTPALRDMAGPDDMTEKLALAR